MSRDNLFIRSELIDCARLSSLVKIKGLVLKLKNTFRICKCLRKQVDVKSDSNLKVVLV